MKTVIPRAMGYATNTTQGARATEETRREIQNSQESLIKLVAKYGVNPKTMLKWRRRDFTHDAKVGPRKIFSNVLSEAEEETIVTFRKMTGPPMCSIAFKKP